MFYLNLERYIIQGMCKMTDKDNIYCLGTQCPVKKQCLRYTNGIGIAGQFRFIRKCTNQKWYVQDKDKIVKSINNNL